MATIKIFPARNFSSSLKPQKGFTLIEVLLVLGILGSVMAFGLPRFQNQKNKIKSVVRQMSTLSREVRNQARMKRMTYRIAFRLGEGKDAYWIESAPGNVLIPSQATQESLEKLDEKERPANPFQKVTKFFKDEKEIPSGLYLGSIETPAGKEAITQGMAYVYYSPEGLVEKAIIQITNKESTTWSLILNPLTGHADIVEKAMSLKDLKFD